MVLEGEGIIDSSYVLLYRLLVRHSRVKKHDIFEDYDFSQSC